MTRVGSGAKRWRWGAAALCLWGLVWAGAAVAQESLRKGTPSPVTLVRVCASLDAAQEQLRLGAQFGTLRFSTDGLVKHLHPDCRAVRARILIARDAEPVGRTRTWTPTADSRPTHEDHFVFAGAAYTARYSMKLQDVTCYAGRYQGPTGIWWDGYIEVPDAPYFVKPL